MPAFQFKIQLKNVENPPVWRRVLVPSDITFSTFHDVIQIAFGWENCHLYQFSPKGWGSGPAIQLTVEEDFGETIDSEVIELSEIFTRARQSFVYIYDFGDDWLHQVKLEKISDEVVIIPLCMDGEGACPPEDCGGPWGYMTLLESLADPKHPEHKDMREWLGLARGQKWDVNAFDIKAVNEELRLMRE